MVFGFLGVAAAGLILLGRVVEWSFLRRLTGVLALVALSCWAEWGAVVLSVEGHLRRWIDAGVVVAIGLLIARGALILLFEWLMEGRFGLRVPRLARDVVGLVVYILVVAGVLHAVLGVEIKDIVLTRAYAALARAGMEIPFPQRTIHVRKHRAPKDSSTLTREALSASGLFAGLPDDALDRLAAHSRWLRFAPGEAVIREGEDSRAMYLVGHGAASVLQGDEELASLGEGELFGEIAFLTGQRRSATVRAAGELTIVEIDGVALAALLESRPDLAEELERRMAARLEDLGQARMRGETAELEVGILQQLGLRLRRLVGGAHDFTEPAS